MVQIQTNINMGNGKLSFEINQMAREDATPEEKYVADKLEEIVLGILKQAFDDADVPMKYKEVKRPISEIVKIYRQANRISQSEMAQVLGISRNYLSQIETGKAKNLSARIERKIKEVCSYD